VWVQGSDDGSSWKLACDPGQLKKLREAFNLRGAREGPLASALNVQGRVLVSEMPGRPVALGNLHAAPPGTAEWLASRQLHATWLAACRACEGGAGSGVLLGSTRGLRADSGASARLVQLKAWMVAVAGQMTGQLAAWDRCGGDKMWA